MQINTQEKIESTLKPYLSLEPTPPIHYNLLTLLVQILQSDPAQACKSKTFVRLYTSLAPQLHSLALYKYLQYQLWRDEAISMELREKTAFFTIVEEWIVGYEVRVGKLNTFEDQFLFLATFLEKEAGDIFQKVVLLDEVYEDLLELIAEPFWKAQELPLNLHPAFPHSSIVSLLSLLPTLTYPHNLTLPSTPHPQPHYLLSLIGGNLQHYNHFMLCSLNFVLLGEGLTATEQTEITKIALMFLERSMIQEDDILSVIRKLMMKTDKAVRFALINEYVAFYGWVEKAGLEQVLEAVDDMVYFRELIIGRNQIDQSGLLTPPLSLVPNKVHIPARSKTRIYWSHEPTKVYPCTFLNMEILLDAGDISLALLQISTPKIGQTQKDFKQKEKVVWKHEKSQDRRVQILLAEPGLYALELDNSYSWIRGKNITYKMDGFRSQGMQ